MAKSKNILQLVTANRLNDGLVVFLNDDGRWTEAISQARLVNSREDAASLLSEGSLAGSDDIVEPYLIDVEIVDGSVAPVRYREKLRGQGPSVRADLGPQSRVPHFRAEFTHV